MNRSEKFIIHFVLIATIVAYFQIFKLIFIPNPVQVLSQVFVCALLIILILFRIIYFNEEHAKMNFKFPILLLTLGAIPSFFIAYIYHKQNFIITTYANRALLFYLLYFFLHLYKVPVKMIVRIIILTGLFAVALYYIQLVLYPKFIMNLSSTMESRGTIRLFIPGLLCTMAAYFYFLNRYFETNNIRLLILSLLTLSVFILQGTRQLIFSTAFLTLLNLILSNRVKSKPLMVVIISMASFAAFMVFREIFMAIAQVSTNQVANFENDIRVRAAKFFLTSFMPNNLAYLFGNSNSEAGSPYNLKIAYYAIKYGFYLNDIGIIGDYVRYGVIFTIGSIYLLIKSLTIKVTNDYKFLKYYILAQCFTLIAGKGVLGGADIVLVCTLYIFDIENAKLITKQK